MTTIAGKQKATNFMPWLVACAVLAVIGLAAWIVQLTQGFDILGVSQAVSWGVYIAAFFLLAGAGSGLIILAAAADLGWLAALQGQRRMLLAAAIGCFVAAGVMILMDIGKPERVINMILSPNFGSMFVWDFIALALSVVLALVYLYMGPMGKLLPWVAGIVAAAVVIVEGWILASSAATVMWHSALVPVIFLLEGLVTALALIILANGKAAVGRLLAGLLAAVLVLTLIELFTLTNAGDPDLVVGVGLLLGGSLAVYYWGQLLLGLVLPFVLLVWFGASRTAVMAAAILAIIGVFVAKLVLLVAGQALPFMGAQASYMPSLVELAAVIGMVGLAGLVYLLVNRYLPGKA
jgi:molybdopterin-containing oxidoreductase family membrane subunit